MRYPSSEEAVMMTTRTQVATAPVFTGCPPLSRLGRARIPGSAGGGPASGTGHVPPPPAHCPRP